MDSEFESYALSSRPGTGTSLEKSAVQGSAPESRRFACTSANLLCWFPAFHYAIFSLTLRDYSVSPSTLSSCISCTWIGIFNSYAFSSSPVAGTLDPTLSLLRLRIQQQCEQWISVYYYRLKVRRILFTFHLLSVLIRHFQNIIDRSTSSSNLCDFLCENVRFHDHLAYSID
jgi:hypothetical protein